MAATRSTVLNVVVAAIVTGVACGAPATSGGEAPRPTRPARRSNQRITERELTASTARDALQAVQMLRPDWLVGRGATSLAGGVPEVLVYLDGQRMGTKQILSQFGLAGIQELRYYSAPDATQRWGTGHDGGVIEIISRKQ